MYKSLLVSLAIFSLATQTCAAPSPQKIVAKDDEATSQVRKFLDVFVSDPVGSEALVTSDAVLIEGDVGGNFGFYAPEVGRSAKRLSSCKVVSLQRDLVSRQGVTFNGGYSCDGPNGIKRYVPLSVTLANGLVSKFWISWLD